MNAEELKQADPRHRPAAWRRHLHAVIFEAKTPVGKAFDILILMLIVLSVIVVMLDSVAEIHNKYWSWLVSVEWVITILFTFEYIARLACVSRPWLYARSFYGIVDLLAVLPTYLSVFFVGSQTLMMIRVIRLLRIFRVFKLSRHLKETRALLIALKATRQRVTVFLVTVLTLILIIGSIMYLIEGGDPDTQFTSFPRSVY